jgi:hypothetical protein
MENYPDGKASIQIRERIVLPLLTIQQYALLRINLIKKVRQMKFKKSTKKIVMRSLLEHTQVETQHKHTKMKSSQLPVTEYAPSYAVYIQLGTLI